MFSLSRGVNFSSFGCFTLLNIATRLPVDLVFLGVSVLDDASRTRLGSLERLSFDLSFSLSFPSDRSDIELFVFLCRLFVGLVGFASWDLRGRAGGCIGIFWF